MPTARFSAPAPRARRHPAAVATRSRRHFSLQAKLAAIEMAREMGNANAARRFNVHRKAIREWCACEARFRELLEQGGEIDNNKCSVKGETNAKFGSRWEAFL